MKKTERGNVLMIIMGNIKIRKKGDSYEAYIPIDGKRVYRSGKTEKEAKQRLKELIEKADRGEQISKTKRLDESLESYLNDVKKLKIKATSFDRTECIYRVHIKRDRIGRLQVANISPEDLQKFINDKCNTGLSESSLKKIYNLLGEFFRYISKKGIIRHNPMELVEMPHSSYIQQKDKEIEVFTLDEVKKIIRTAESVDEDGKPQYRYGEAVVLLLLTGLRVGELQGLHIDNISLNDKVLRINRSVYTMKNRDGGGVEVVVGEVKTKKSRRTIPLNDRAVLAVQRLLETTYNSETGYLLCTDKGKIVTYSNFRKNYHAILKSADVERKGIHATRHTFATMSLKNAEDKGRIKDVSEILGHSDVTVTYRYYIKTDNEDKRDLMDQVGRLIY